MLLYWEFYVKKIWQKDRKRGCRSRYWGIKCGKASSSKIERKDYLHKQSFSLCCLSSYIYTGKGYDSELFRVFFGSQAD